MLIKVNNFPPLFLAEIICAITMEFLSKPDYSHLLWKNHWFQHDHLSNASKESSLKIKPFFLQRE